MAKDSLSQVEQTKEYASGTSRTRVTVDLLFRRRKTILHRAIPMSKSTSTTTCQLLMLTNIYFCHLFVNSSRPIDGTYVIQEIYNGNQQQPTGSGGASSRAVNVDEIPKPGPELPSVGHNDVITDLVLCRTQKQTFVASSSRDGVIKLWK